MTGRQESGTIAAAMANAREDGSGKCKCRGRWNVFQFGFYVLHIYIAIPPFMHILHTPTELYTGGDGDTFVDPD